MCLAALNKIHFVVLLRLNSLCSITAFTKTPIYTPISLLDCHLCDS